MGDVRPIIALALSLRARGFEILLFGDGAHERSALRAGIAAREWLSSSHVPQTFTFRTVAGQRWLWGQRPRYRDRWMGIEIARHEAERVDAFWRRVSSPGNPRIVAAIGSISAYRMLGAFGPTCAKVISCPMPYQPSRFFTLAPPDLSLAERFQAWRLRRFLRAERRRFCEETFHFVSASPAVFPRPGDWLPNMQVTGYILFEDDLSGWAPPAGLSDFLRVGAPPVYVGFGSYPFFYGHPGDRLARAIIEGCRRHDVRCIIQSSDLPSSMSSEGVYVLEGDVPHAWLFPRCAAIVHHGGYGTLHAALAARRPMVIYPFQTDQFLWAKRMGELGVGPGYTARLRAVSAARLQDDLALVLTRECQERARALSLALTLDQGLAIQVAAVESAIEHTRRGLSPLEWQMPASTDGGNAEPAFEVTAPPR
jgi:UDP:flavonoid glycosyltransferase YjiC (YdhE family)